MKASPFVVLNAKEARFECVFGRGCDGICCRNGRPSVTSADRARIGRVLSRVLPGMREEARKVVERVGYISRRLKEGKPMMRVAGGWCVFFNQGCLLHVIGDKEGAPWRYKPTPCILFPVDRAPDGRWYVRQKGVRGEQWELPCLDPAASNVRAVDSLRAELQHARQCHAGVE